MYLIVEISVLINYGRWGGDNTNQFRKETSRQISISWLLFSRKYTYQDDGEVVTESFALGMENMEILRAKIKKSIVFTYKISCVIRPKQLL